MLFLLLLCQQLDSSCCTDLLNTYWLRLSYISPNLRACIILLSFYIHLYQIYCKASHQHSNVGVEFQKVSTKTRRKKYILEGFFFVPCHMFRASCLMHKFPHVTRPPTGFWNITNWKNLATHCRNLLASAIGSVPFVYLHTVVGSNKESLLSTCGTSKINVEKLTPCTVLSRHQLNYHGHFCICEWSAFIYGDDNKTKRPLKKLGASVWRWHSVT